jgi:hypothetical protein
MGRPAYLRNVTGFSRYLMFLSELREISSVKIRFCSSRTAPPDSLSLRPLRGNTEDLDGRDDGISSFDGNKITCRIQVSTPAFDTSIPADILYSSLGTIHTHPRQEAHHIHHTFH